MRIWPIGLALLALTGCNSGEPSGSEDRPAAQETAADIDEKAVTLRPDGLVVGSEAFYFAAGRREVEGSLARALGKPGDSGENAECGAGPMASATYADSLTVNFQDGSLVGWFLRDDSAGITVSDGIAIGTPRDEVEAMTGFAMMEDSTLGEEFALGDELAGFFEDGEVAMLYSGTQCFFR